MNRSVQVKHATALLALSLVALPASAGMLISEALSRAVEADPQFAAAAATQRANRELGEQERAALRPSVALRANADYAYTDADFAFGASDEDYAAWSAVLEVRQPLLRLDWGARLDRAEARDALAEVEYRAAEIDFIARVSERYLNALLAEDQLRQTEAEARAIRESLDDTQKRYDVELVPGTDLKEAQARDDLIQAQLIAARGQVEETRDALEEITGYARGPLPRLRETLDLPPLTDSDVESWYRTAQDSNVDLLRARLQTELARTNRQSRKAEALPSLDVVASAGRNDSQDYSLGQLQDEARIGVELTVPLYAGGINHSRVREAEARIDEADLALTRAQREVRSAIRKAYRDVVSALTADKAYSQVLASAEAAERAVQAGYDAGTRTIADVLDAQSRVVQAQRDRNEVRYDLLIKALILQATAGTLSVDMVAAMDRLFEQPDAAASPAAAP